MFHLKIGIKLMPNSTMVRLTFLASRLTEHYLSAKEKHNHHNISLLHSSYILVSNPEESGITIY